MYKSSPSKTFMTLSADISSGKRTNSKEYQNSSPLFSRALSLVEPLTPVKKLKKNIQASPMRATSINCLSPLLPGLLISILCLLSNIYFIRYLERKTISAKYIQSLKDAVKTVNPSDKKKNLSSSHSEQLRKERKEYERKKSREKENMNRVLNYVKKKYGFVQNKKHPLQPKEQSIKKRRHYHEQDDESDSSDTYSESEESSESSSSSQEDEKVLLDLNYDSPIKQHKSNFFQGSNKIRYDDDDFYT